MYLDLKLYFIICMIINLYYLVLSSELISQASYNCKYSRQALLCIKENSQGDCSAALISIQVGQPKIKHLQ